MRFLFGVIVGMIIMCCYNECQDLKHIQIGNILPPAPTSSHTVAPPPPSDTPTYRLNLQAFGKLQKGQWL